MTTVYKYILPSPTYSGTVSIKQDARILKVQMQGQDACLWALVDEYALDEIWSITSFGTGHDIHNIETLHYLGAVFDVGYVWHYFRENQ